MTRVVWLSALLAVGCGDDGGGGDGGSGSADAASEGDSRLASDGDGASAEDQGIVSDDGVGGDSGLSSDAGLADPCRDAPFETYETFGRGFLLTWCAGCHATTSTERFGAPPEISFDTRDEARRLGDRILARAATAPYTMPPSGGASEEDRERLRVWLTCFEGP